jgi:hypothetical protein
MREPYVAVDPEDAAFGFKTFQNGIKSDYLVNYGLHKPGIIVACGLISGTVLRKPDPVIVAAQV